MWRIRVRSSRTVYGSLLFGSHQVLKNNLMRLVILYEGDEGYRSDERATHAGDPNAAVRYMNDLLRTGRVNRDDIWRLAIFGIEPARVVMRSMGGRFKLPKLDPVSAVTYCLPGADRLIRAGVAQVFLNAGVPDEIIDEYYGASSGFTVNVGNNISEDLIELMDQFMEDNPEVYGRFHRGGSSASGNYRYGADVLLHGLRSVHIGVGLLWFLEGAGVNDAAFGRILLSIALSTGVLPAPLGIVVENF